MKIARIETESGIVTLAAQGKDGALLRASGDLLAGNVTATSEVVKPKRWLSPIEPRSLLCIGRNYAAHAAEGGAPPPDYPILFFKNPNAATARATGAPSTRTRRTISYLTCTRSRASRNSEDANCSSRTASGRGFSVRVSASAASFASDFRFRATATTSNSM